MKDSSFPLQLEENNLRPVGLADSKGVSHRAVDTSPADAAPSDSSLKGSGASNTAGSTQTPTQGTYHPCRCGGQPESRILLYHFPGSQERVQADEASSEFEASQQVSTGGPFQDGRRVWGARSPPKRGLDVQDRLEGCVFCNTSLQRTPASPVFHLGLRDVSVYMPSPLGLAPAPRVFTKDLCGQ